MKSVLGALTCPLGPFQLGSEVAKLHPQRLVFVLEPGVDVNKCTLQVEQRFSGGVLNSSGFGRGEFTLNEEVTEAGKGLGKALEMRQQGGDTGRGDEGRGGGLQVRNEGFELFRLHARHSSET